MHPSIHPFILPSNQHRFGKKTEKIIDLRIDFEAAPNALLRFNRKSLYRA